MREMRFIFWGIHHIWVENYKMMSKKEDTEFVFKGFGKL